LAHYLEVPTPALLDEITEAEVAKLDARRGELLSVWRRAVAVPVEQVEGSSVWLKGQTAPIASTERFGRALSESGADAVVVAGFTLGGRVDRIVSRHLDAQEVYEAFVLKQWAATMAEQARVELTGALRGWADDRGHALMPYDGPGYNGWPLEALRPLLDVLYDAAGRESVRPIRATESGVLLPTNSMLIVCGLTREAGAKRDRRDIDSLAQCHRCSMRNCRYRITV
jgi:hypothetical protein